MDVEVHSFDSINVYDPDIVFTFQSNYLFTLANEVKKLQIEDRKNLSSKL